MQKKEVQNKQRPAPEKYWQSLVDVYFAFYKDHFRDNDGFKMTPDWSPAKRGMEARGLKGIIQRLRTIAEEKNIEWSEQYAKESIGLFFEKAYTITFLKNNFMCCMLNKYKDQVIISENINPNLVTQILEVWYFNFPEYTVERDTDRVAASKIVSFLKDQYKTASIVFSEPSVIQTVNVLVKFIKEDEFWKTKSLKSISYNMQELINKIKSKNGTDKAFSREGLANEFNRRYQTKRGNGSVGGE